MAITDEIRKAFDECTVMAGVENDFECVYMTKGAALLYLDEIDAESDRMREQVDAAHMSRLLTENENEKLREQIHWLKQGDILHVLTDQEYIDQCERERLMQVSIDALDKENAKLRELVEDMLDYIEIREAFGRPPTSERCKEFAQRADELGVEVNG